MKFVFMLLDAPWMDKHCLLTHQLSTRLDPTTVGPAHAHPNYKNVVWESDWSASNSSHTHLHYQHVISVHALSSKVTHVANQPCFSTPCLPHDDNWDTTPECVVWGGWGREGKSR